MSRASRKEDQFYVMLKTLSSDVNASAELFNDIAAKWPDSRDSIPAVSALEVQCDKGEDAIRDALNTSFMTPFDREDLNALVRDLDEIVDSIESAAVRFELFDVHDMIPECSSMTELIAKSTFELKVLFEQFSGFKRNTAAVIGQVNKVIAFEDAGDVVYRNALGRIFSVGAEDAIHVLKWKSLLDAMEGILDTCCDVAETVLNVVVKNA